MAQSRFYPCFLSLTFFNLALDVPFHSKRALINGTVNLYHHRSFLWIFTLFVNAILKNLPSLLSGQPPSPFSSQADALSTEPHRFWLPHVPDTTPAQHECRGMAHRLVGKSRLRWDTAIVVHMSKLWETLP